VNNPTPLEAKDHFEIVMNSNDDISSNDDDSFYKENIEYVEASPHDSKVVNLEVAEIVIPEVEEIEDDNLRNKFLNVHLLIANIEALKDNPTPSSKLLTKSSSTSPKSFLEETNTFHNSLPEFKNFYFDLEEISTTTHSDISLPDYEAFSFNNDHIKEISSGSTTTHCDISLSEYDSFIFDFTHEEFADELAHIISPPEYDCFYFWNLPDPGELMSVLNFGIRENLSSITCVNLPIEDYHFPLLAYVVWIFLAYLTYPVIPPYLYPLENEDTIFDPSITINRFYSFKPGLSHRCGAFKKFNTHCSHLNECLMIINGKNTPILDQEEKRIEEEQAASARYWKILACCDDDDDYDSTITPVLSTEETENSLSIPDTMCDLHLVNNPTPLEAKDHFEIVMNSNDDISSNDDDSFYKENIEYVEASPHDSEVVNLEVAEIVIPEVKEIEDDNLRDKFLNVHLLIANIEALKDKINSGSTTTHFDISLFEYDSFTFDLSYDQCPPTDKSDFANEEFVDELAHIISPPEYDCFYFRNLPDPGELMFILNFGIRENSLSATCVNLPIKDDHSPLLAYVMLKSSYKAKDGVKISIPPLSEAWPMWWSRYKAPVKDSQEKDKIGQNRIKTGSVTKPGKVKSSYCQESKKN
nr:hypothetical protein [Tanacetum cinerariifolium]